MKFNNLNLGQKIKPEFTERDVASEALLLTEEKVDYANHDPVVSLGSKVNTFEVLNPAFNLKFIPREKIQFNQNNDFEIKDIEELAESIMLIGMQHNLGAFYDSELDRYILESGERRLRACDLLHEKYNGKNNVEDENYLLYERNVLPFYEKGFPINIKKAKVDDEDEKGLKLDHIDSELRKYKVNIDVRSFTPQERAQYIQKVKVLLQQRNQILYGSDAPLPTQPELAVAVGTSERQLRKYNALDQLIPALRQEFEAGNISINKVPGIAALPEEEQMLFLDLLQRGKRIDPSQLQLYQNQLENSEREKKAAEEEKQKLEEELQRIRISKDDEISNILQKSKEREELLRKQIEQAEWEKNEDAIMRLQNELAQERESSGRLIAETNKSLEDTKKALNVANQKIEKYSEKEQWSEKSLKMKVELTMQLDLVMQSIEKSMELFSSYQKMETSMPPLLKDTEITRLKKFVSIFDIESN